MTLDHLTKEELLLLGQSSTVTFTSKIVIHKELINRSTNKINEDGSRDLYFLVK